MCLRVVFLWAMAYKSFLNASNVKLGEQFLADSYIICPTESQQSLEHLLSTIISDANIWIWRGALKVPTATDITPILSELEY